jgi:hypothetical protein
MTDYQKVIDKLQENNLSWNDVDRIHLNPDTYEQFQERASFKTSNYATDDSPAVRETQGQECIKYVAENGMMVTIEL